MHGSRPVPRPVGSGLTRAVLFWRFNRNTRPLKNTRYEFPVIFPATGTNDTYVTGSRCDTRFTRENDTGRSRTRSENDFFFFFAAIVWYSYTFARRSFESTHSLL